MDTGCGNVVGFGNIQRVYSWLLNKSEVLSSSIPN